MAAQQSPVPSSIFKAYDIRGIVDITLTNEGVETIGHALGSEMMERSLASIVVGADGRLSSPRLKSALIKGLCKSGCEVIDIGQVPTPVLYYAAHTLCAGSGIMVTGSHNPPEYNGLKLMVDGETLGEERLLELLQRINEGRFIDGEGEQREQDVVEDYVARIVDSIQLAHPFRVVVDTGNGVAGGIAPRVLESLGCHVVAIYGEVDGSFPNHHPDPNRPENLQTLRDYVMRLEADIGIAFDGDGDRLGVVDGQGNIIWPDRLMMLYAEDLLSRHPGAEVIYDVKCSQQLGYFIRNHGGRPLMWKSGHTCAKAKMRETGALLAGEMSGHIFFAEDWYGFDDAIYAAALLLRILSHRQGTPYEVFTALPNAVNTPELHLSMKEGQAEGIVAQLLSNVGCFDGGVLSTVDGLRVDFDDGWVLVRASNTTPTLVMRFEASDEVGLRMLEEKIRALLLKIDPTLALPF